MPKLTSGFSSVYLPLNLGLNIGEIANILNSGTSICLSCIGVG
jgi:hypothetical protein